MTNRTWRLALATFVLVLAVGPGSLAVAQGTSGSVGTSGTVGTTETSGSVNASGGVDPGNQQALKPVTPAEQLTAAEAIVQRGTLLAQRLGQMLDEARREADMIRVTCLNDKLTQANANLHTAQNRLTAFQKAADDGQRNHEFTVLSVLGQKFQLLEQTGNQCVGQDMYETGPTKIVVEIDTSLMPFENDPGSPPMMLPPVVVVDVPPPMSPTGT